MAATELRFPHYSAPASAGIVNDGGDQHHEGMKTLGSQDRLDPDSGSGTTQSARYLSFLEGEADVVGVEWYFQVNDTRRRMHRWMLLAERVILV